ncbi:PQQ-binding-like beta-propeller repeat protein [Actinomadura sp. WMMB 499]|nr:PQQ-binding-like beta-propeller repeat protein [Actinomadura sp. WMMB 499]
MPASLREVLAACLAKEPAGRPPLDSVLAALTPADLHVLTTPALRREIAAREAEATRVATEPVTLPPTPRVDDTEAGKVGRRRILGIAAVAVAGIGAGTAGWASTRGTSTPAKPAPRASAPATAPPPAWTFTPPRPMSGTSIVLVAGDVVLWGGGEDMYGVDARSGRRLWTQEKANAAYSGNLARGSSFVVVGGVVGDFEDQRIMSIDARTGRTTNLPRPRAVSASSVLGVVGDTVIVASPRNVWALDLATGEIRWHLSDHRWLSGAVDRTGLYLSTDPSLAALDPATGRERWVRTWPASGDRDGASLDIAVAGGRVFGNFGDTLQAVDTATGRPVWSRDTDTQFDTVVPAGGDVIFKDEVLRVYDQATGAPRWTLAGPEPFHGDPGHLAADGGLVAAAFSDPAGPSRGILVAGTDGRALWTHRAPTGSQSGWHVAVSGSSVFAADDERLYRFEARR